MVEQESHKLLEVGSIPTRPTGKNRELSVFPAPDAAAVTQPVTQQMPTGGIQAAAAAADPDLLRVVAAWGELPAHVKAAVLALVGTAGG